MKEIFLQLITRISIYRMQFTIADVDYKTNLNLPHFLRSHLTCMIIHLSHESTSGYTLTIERVGRRDGLEKKKKKISRARWPFEEAENH